MFHAILLHGQNNLQRKPLGLHSSWIIDVAIFQSLNHHFFSSTDPSLSPCLCICLYINPHTLQPLQQRSVSTFSGARARRKCAFQGRHHLDDPLPDAYASGLHLITSFPAPPASLFRISAISNTSSFPSLSVTIITLSIYHYSQFFLFFLKKSIKLHLLGTKTSQCTLRAKR